MKLVNSIALLLLPTLVVHASLRGTADTELDNSGDRALAAGPKVLKTGGLVDGEWASYEYEQWEGDSFSRLPGLQKFYFNFEGGGDKHIQTIGVLTEQKGVTMEYSDNSGDDNYFYSHRAVELPDGTEYYDSGWLSGEDGGGLKDHLIGTIPKDDKVPVLRGFRVGYWPNDHHIDQIYARVFTSDEYCTSTTCNLYLEVGLNDKNNDDHWEALVEYALVPKDKVVQSFGTESAVSDNGGEDSKKLFDPVIGTEPVLTGFYLNFKSKDHHLDRIGVELNNDGKAYVRYQDKNKDDDYSWRVYGSLIKA